jgi:hypothetical protein
MTTALLGGRQFQALTTSPRLLAIDGFAVGHGLPDGPVPLGKVRDLGPMAAIMAAGPRVPDVT